MSQGSPKEVGPQVQLAKAIGLQDHRFEGRVSERWYAPYEGSTRGRSLIFFAYGALAATAHGLNQVIVPENGLIAINPPFTQRRMGSLSTRTTHPHFLGLLEKAMAGAGLSVRLTNIFEGATKGEMMVSSGHQALSQLASQSYSCGKGKRLNAQCGRCVPCLILQHRLPIGLMKDPRAWLSVGGANFGLGLLLLLEIALAGPMGGFVIHTLIILMAATVGMWLFYVQHQFENGYWARTGAWTSYDAALRGSSHLALPPVLRWLTANIGAHHIHHLGSRIPFYRLPEVMRNHPELKASGRMTLDESFRCARLALWDEAGGRLAPLSVVRRHLAAG